MQHENLPIQDINFPTKNSKSPDLGSRMYHMYDVDVVMLCSIFLEMSLDFATLTSVKKVRNLQHENLPIQDINFPTKNSKSPDLGSRMYHMYGGQACSTLKLHFRELHYVITLKVKKYGCDSRGVAI